MLVANFLSSHKDGLLKVHDSVEPYLDFEPFSHPDIGRSLGYFHEAGMRPLMHTIPTSGIAVARSGDPDSVFEVARRHWVEAFMLTLHGPIAVQETAIGYPGAAELQQHFAQLAGQSEFAVKANVIVTTDVCENPTGTARFMEALEPDEIRLTLPVHEPVAGSCQSSANRPPTATRSSARRG
jgi:hypothetical protein